MRLLADQDVYAMTVMLLRKLNHDVETAAELNLAQASDIELLEAAIRDRRVLLPADPGWVAYELRRSRRWLKGRGR
jgi:predicted nuclease of predicted toxin-antitoxin system